MEHSPFFYLSIIFIGVATVGFILGTIYESPELTDITTDEEEYL